MKTLDFVSSMLRSREDQMHHFWVGKTTMDIGLTKINLFAHASSVDLLH